MCIAGIAGLYCGESQALWLLGHPLGQPFRSSYTLHGTDDPRYSEPLNGMGAYCIGPRVPGLPDPLNANWGKVDSILSHTLGPRDMPWYKQSNYCPFGLPPDVVGQCYTRRYHLSMLALSEVLAETDQGAGSSSGVMDVDGDEQSMASKLLNCLAFSHEVIHLRARALHMPHSYIIWSSTLQRWTNPQFDPDASDYEAEYEPIDHA